MNIKFPCEVGSRVWIISFYDEDADDFVIDRDFVTQFQVTEHGVFANFSRCHFEDISSFGETVFLSPEGRLDEKIKELRAAMINS